MLDTDHCIELLRGNPLLVSRLEALSEEAEIYTTIINVAELFYGVKKSPYPDRGLSEVRAFLEDIRVLLLDLHAAEIYGKLKAELSRKGELIPDNDLLIASITLSHGFTLVTHNIRHYSRISGLKIEDWLK